MISTQDVVLMAPVNISLGILRLHASSKCNWQLLAVGGGGILSSVL